MPFYKLFGTARPEWDISKKMLQTLEDGKALSGVGSVLNKKLNVSDVADGEIKFYLCDKEKNPIREIDPKQPLSEQQVPNMSFLFVAPADDVPKLPGAAPAAAPAPAAAAAPQAPSAAPLAKAATPWAATSMPAPAENSRSLVADQPSSADAAAATAATKKNKDDEAAAATAAAAAAVKKKAADDEAAAAAARAAAARAAVAKKAEQEAAAKKQLEEKAMADKNRPVLKAWFEENAPEKMVTLEKTVRRSLEIGLDETLKSLKIRLGEKPKSSASPELIEALASSIVATAAVASKLEGDEKKSLAPTPTPIVATDAAPPIPVSEVPPPPSSPTTATSAAANTTSSMIKLVGAAVMVVVLVVFGGLFSSSSSSSSSSAAHFGDDASDDNTSSKRVQIKPRPPPPPHPHADARALLAAFQNATAIPPSWSNLNPLQNWQGVMLENSSNKSTLAKFTRRVVALDLSKYGKLGGHVDAGLLPNRIERLLLQNNEIVSFNFNCTALAKTLRELNVANNSIDAPSLDGCLSSPSLSWSSVLAHVDLSNNNFTSCYAPLRTLPSSVTTASFSNNFFRNRHVVVGALPSRMRVLNLSSFNNNVNNQYVPKLDRIQRKRRDGSGRMVGVANAPRTLRTLDVTSCGVRGGYDEVHSIPPQVERFAFMRGNFIDTKEESSSPPEITAKAASADGEDSNNSNNSNTSSSDSSSSSSSEGLFEAIAWIVILAFVAVLCLNEFVGSDPRVKQLVKQVEDIAQPILNSLTEQATKLINAASGATADKTKKK